MVKVFVVLIAFFAISCNLVSPRDSESTSRSQQPQSLKSDNTEVNQNSLKNCLTFKRALNPPVEAIASESELDRHFRLAFNYETEANFDQAILHYRQARELADCECDRLHAEAGIQAATEASAILAKEGMTAKPTQFFWGRLQDLTQTLPCIEIN